MMTLLKLTTANGFCSTKDIYINAAQIKLLDPCYSANLTTASITPKTNLHLTDGTRIRVHESPDDVIAMIRQMNLSDDNVQILGHADVNNRYQHNRVIH